LFYSDFESYINRYVLHNIPMIKLEVEIEKDILYADYQTLI